MKQVNIHQAKTQLSQLVADVERGEEVVIARAGKPVARIVPLPIEPQRKPLREPGRMKGEFWFAPDYDEADAMIEKLFEDSINAPMIPGAKP